MRYPHAPFYWFEKHSSWGYFGAVQIVRMFPFRLPKSEATTSLRNTVFPANSTVCSRSCFSWKSPYHGIGYCLLFSIHSSTSSVANLTLFPIFTKGISRFCETQESIVKMLSPRSAASCFLSRNCPFVVIWAFERCVVCWFPLWFFMTVSRSFEEDRPLIAFEMSLYTHRPRIRHMSVAVSKCRPICSRMCTPLGRRLSPEGARFRSKVGCFVDSILRKECSLPRRVRFRVALIRRRWCVRFGFFHLGQLRRR